MERFRLTALPNGDTCTLIVAGDVDLERAPEIVELATASLDEASSQTLVIHLGAVTFMDSTGLGALITVRNAAEQRGKRVALDAIPPRVQRLLDLTNLNDFFTVVGTAPTAALASDSEQNSPA
jgi:anti-sigma B factor antagonist